MLVSDDTNACTQAELENIPTFSLQRLLSAIHKHGPSTIQHDIYKLYHLCQPNMRHYLSQPAVLAALSAHEWQALGSYTPP